MNPCRCGYLDDPSLACARAPRCAADYQARISGPLLDRIDLHVEVPALCAADMSAAAARRAARRGRGAGRARARELQAERFAELGAARSAHQRRGRRRAARPDRRARCAGRELLRRAAERMHLTARGYHRVLRVARTIADLDGGRRSGEPHIAEALSFRRIAPERR